MRYRLNWILVLLCLEGAAAANDITPSIVNIYTTYQKPNWSRPWQMESAGATGGSGCIIDGGRILTNAHVVSNQTFIQVRRAGSPDRFVAEVEAVSHELDLALLRVKDAAFFKGAKPIPIGGLPQIGDRVVAYGFPSGGTRVTITRGVVSRIDRQSYSHSGHKNLVCQIDAAINPGSSGGPVLGEGNQIIGVAFQASRGQSVGYVIPTIVINHFLADVKDGRQGGTPLLPVTWQLLENPSLREQLGLAPDASGVVFRRLLLGSTSFQVGDVLLSVDGKNVGNDGTIELRPGQRIDFEHATDRRQLGSSIPAVVWRKGAEKKLEIELNMGKQSYPYVMPRRSYDKAPSYFVFGGLVFSPLTVDYAMEWGKWGDAPFQLRRYWYEARTEENAWRKQVVACIETLPDSLNAGYAWAENDVVESVNGKRIGTMRDLIAAFESHKGSYHRIRFEPTGAEIVLDRRKAVERSAKILDRYRVPFDRSRDLR